MSYAAKELQSFNLKITYDFFKTKIASRHIQINVNTILEFIPKKT